ncbi:phosphotransferase enzyme family protein [Paenibacillus sp. R14(2021)]|uniref:phosphotransferase enzyme family protein n=1 Tax=Paenibacillus sp. R14(2021) TaxID=2859228 RepID=UPI001C614261|nr:phosphotransferase [Paenibacillus sp. R14(2021)]
MNSGFQMDTDANRRQTLARTKQAALIALQEYEVDWHAIHFIQVSEHATFRVESSTGEHYLLRIHASSKPDDATKSELEWLAFLRSKGTIVPHGVPNRAGGMIVHLVLDDGQRFDATLLTWIEGERLDRGTLTEDHIARMGLLLAELHESSADFIPPSGFTRPIWGSESFKRDWSHLQRHHSHFITEHAFELYSRAADKVAGHLAALIPIERHYGMIHADLHIGNIVIHADKPYAIDFGRCGFGHHLYDMAQSIMGLRPHHRKQFIEGYKKVRTMGDDAIPLLESFLIMSLMEAYSFHAENMLEAEGLIEEQPYAMALLNAYVNGEPFLFQPLDEVSIEVSMADGT